MEKVSKIDATSGELVEQSEVIEKYIVPSNSIFGEDAEFSIDSLILPIAFLIPFLLSVLPNFSRKAKVIKRLFQTIFSVWFSYNSYLMVFTIGSPLIAGWVLSFASIGFFILCSIEWVPKKHNKIKNENANDVGTDAQKTARPF